VNADILKVHIQYRMVIVSTVGVWNFMFATRFKQEATNLRMIEISHKIRYQYAATKIKTDDVVLDVCCGVGYGAFILANESDCISIDAFDASYESVSVGREYYKHPKISYHIADACTVNLPTNRYDFVTMFEAIEHLTMPLSSLSEVSISMKEGAKMMISTPCVEWDPERFKTHVRHYTLDQMCEMLEDVGLTVNRVRYQKKNNVRISNRGGDYMIIEATK